MALLPNNFSTLVVSDCLSLGRITTFMGFCADMRDLKSVDLLKYIRQILADEKAATEESQQRGE